MNTISIGDLELVIEDGGLPPLIASYLNKAQFVDRIDFDSPEGRFLFIGVAKGNWGNGWPTLVSVQKYTKTATELSPQESY